MGVVEAFLVFPVASLNLAIVTRRIGADLFVLDVQEAERLLKQGKMFCFIVGEAVGKLKTIVSLNAFHFETFSFEFIDNPEQELIRRISGLFRISTQDPITGILVNSGVLEQAKFWISDAFTRNDFHINLDSFPGMSHLLIRFGLVGILLFDCYKPFAFQYPPEGFQASGITSFSQLAPEFNHPEFGVSSPHVMNEL